MITAEGMKPFGLAVRDFYAGDVSSEVVFRRDDGVVSTLAVSAFFRGPLDFQVDKVLLDRCAGKVLDVGAGSGIHSLYLQSKGFTVYALDVSPEACHVMKRRGVKNIICSNVSDLPSGAFDTILILGRSICMVETLSGLDSFLAYARNLVNPSGQILLNSLDVACTKDPRDLAYHELNRKAGRYIGEIRVSLEYKDLVGPKIGMLHVDPVELARYAAKTGWVCDVLLKEKDGHYAARLGKKD
jgi:SAM-dependent methyltransferase